jgi:YidC/Oxa1 family membrane protein insertase
MDRRTLLALVLTAIVIVATPMIFPSPRRELPAPRDSIVVARDSSAPTPVPIAAQTPTVSAAPPSRTPSAPVAAQRAETTVVRTSSATYGFVSPGGTISSVTLPAYRSLRAGAQAQTPVELVPPNDRLIHLRLVASGGRDTLAFDTVAFRAAPPRTEGGSVIQEFTSTSATTPITLRYRLQQDSFVVHVEGEVATPAAPAVGAELLVTLPSRIRSEEANEVEDTRSLAVGYKRGVDEVESVWFRDLDTLAARIDTGSIRWVAERNKYFLVAAFPTGRDSAFRAVRMRGGLQRGPQPSTASATAVLPLTSQRFALGIYAGPQSWEHLRVSAPDLENVNPYGGWLHGLVQPFATIVMRMLLWIRHTFNVGYGWVLVIFGVLVRLLLWPLNQNAMRSSMKLQRIQPELAELQKKYRNDPEKQREAMLKLYQEHGMSPFTPVLGCLPMLLPMPILFALYFVFQNTIELRGVSFMWLPDLSLKDPLYITPLFMGVSMYALSWIGMKGVPPSPQAKMMLYVMPVMFTVLFWNFASGLNLYYAVQNIAALPQQWLLARERVSKGSTQPPKSGAPPDRGTKRVKA